MSQRLTADMIAQRVGMAEQAKAIGQHLSNRGVTMSQNVQSANVTPISQGGNSSVANLRPSPTPTVRPVERGMSR